MAKAEQALSPRREADPLEWFAEALRFRFRDIIDRTAAAVDPGRAKDIHHLRVAIRRLRSLIADTSEIFDAARLRRVRKELKRLADRLGRVRDHDVYIETLEKLNAAAENDQYSKTIEKLLADSLLRRQRAHQKLAATLSRKFLSDLQEHFTRALDATLRQPELFHPENVRAAGREVTSARMKDLADLAGSIYDPFDDKGLHEIRIAAKRLRYALEVFAPAFGAESQTLADEVARMQTFLGDLHDYDTWIGGLRERLRDPAANHILDSSDRIAVAWILSEFVKKRTESYRSALDLWTTWETDLFGERITKLIEG